MQISLYDASTIDQLHWPENEEGEKAKKYLVPLVKQGVEYFIKNVATEMRILSIGPHLIPITINDAQYENSFVCSPYSHYISYSSVIIRRFENKALKKSLGYIMNKLGNFMQKGELNKNVIINNWLFTTNAHPRINKEEMAAIVEFLKNLFPCHALIFRSVTPETSCECFESLRTNGFDMVASRYVWLTNAKNEEIFNTRIFKSDLKFLKESRYGILEGSELADEDIPKIQNLYQSLYIEKYSNLNPHFNENFIKHTLESKLLNLKAIKYDGQIQGVVGYLCKNDVMISPFFGYDPVKSEKKGVYRVLSTLLMLESKEQKALFNQSAGGSFYKKIRKAEGSMEYTAVYSAHLPFYRKARWKLLKAIQNTVGAKFMKQY